MKGSRLRTASKSFALNKTLKYSELNPQPPRLMIDALRSVQALPEVATSTSTFCTLTHKACYLLSSSESHACPHKTICYAMTSSLRLLCCAQRASYYMHPKMRTENAPSLGPTRLSRVPPRQKRSEPFGAHHAGLGNMLPIRAAFQNFLLRG